MRAKPTGRRLWPILIVCAYGCGGCGGGGSGSTAKPAARPARGTSVSPSPEGSAVPSEAQSAATGDIPDNQAFLSFANFAGGYSISYPEGWTRSGASRDLTFRDRANVIHITISSGPNPTPARALAGVTALQRSDPTVKPATPQQLTMAGAPVVKLTYTRLSAADPVTGKRLPLTIDRYEFAHAGRTAIVDLGTPQGVDNVDAYRMISRSFKWR